MPVPLPDYLCLLFCLIALLLCLLFCLLQLNQAFFAFREYLLILLKALECRLLLTAGLGEPLFVNFTLLPGPNGGVLLVCKLGLKVPVLLVYCEHLLFQLFVFLCKAFQLL